MELILIVPVVLLVFGIVYLSIEPSDFDIKIKEIENILNSSEARKRKYELFKMLDELSNNCTNYSELSKMNNLLIKIYDL